MVASGRQLRKPITLPRPKTPDPKPSPGQDERDAAFKRGISVLQQTAKGVNR